MFEHQALQILEQPQERISALCQCLGYCIRNPLHEVQEAGFRAILSFAMFVRQHSAPLSTAHVLESLLTETTASLFVGGVDTESVSNACAAVHSLAIIIPVSQILLQELIEGQIQPTASVNSCKVSRRQVRAIRTSIREVYCFDTEKV
jgi:hypothetical protein